MKHQGVVIFVNKESEHVSFGELANVERVFINTDSTAAACDKASDGSIEGKYIVGTITPNRDPEKREITPWVCIFVNRMASKEEFENSASPSIKDEATGSNGNGNHDIVVEPDELDDVTDGLGAAVASFLPSINEKELKKAITAELIEEDVEPTAPNFGKLVTERIETAKEKREQAGRDYLAQLLSKGAIPGLIRQEAKRLIELGGENYWGNGNHPKTIMTDIDGSDPVSEPEPEPIAAEPAAAVS